MRDLFSFIAKAKMKRKSMMQDLVFPQVLYNVSKINEPPSSPLGHSSAAFYSMVFTIVYLYKRNKSTSPLILINQVIGKVRKI